MTNINYDIVQLGQHQASMTLEVDDPKSLLLFSVYGVALLNAYSLINGTPESVTISAVDDGSGTTTYTLVITNMIGTGGGNIKYSLDGGTTWISIGAGPSSSGTHTYIFSNHNPASGPVQIQIFATDGNGRTFNSNIFDLIWTVFDPTPTISVVTYSVDSTGETVYYLTIENGTGTNTLQMQYSLDGTDWFNGMYISNISDISDTPVTFINPIDSDGNPVYVSFVLTVGASAITSNIIYVSGGMVSPISLSVVDSLAYPDQSVSDISVTLINDLLTDIGLSTYPNTIEFSDDGVSGWMSWCFTGQNNISPQVYTIVNPQQDTTSPVYIRTYLDYPGTDGIYSNVVLFALTMPSVEINGVTDNGDGTSTYLIEFSGLSQDYSDYLVNLDYSPDGGTTWINFYSYNLGWPDEVQYGIVVSNPIIGSVLIRGEVVNQYGGSQNQVSPFIYGGITWVIPAYTISSLSVTETSGAWIMGWTEAGLIDTSEAVYIQYSTDGGDSFSTLSNTGGHGGNGVISYDVYDGLGQAVYGLMRVTMQDGSGPLVFSNAVTIPSDFIAGAPVDNGDGTSTYSFTIYRNGNSSQIDIQYSTDGGTTWNSVIAATAVPDGVYGSITYENPIVGSCLVQLYCVGLNNIIQSNSAPYSITWSSVGFSVSLNSAVDTGSNSTTYTFTIGGIPGGDSVFVYPQYSIDSGVTWYNVDSGIEFFSNGTYSMKSTPNATIGYVLVRLISFDAGSYFYGQTLYSSSIGITWTYPTPTITINSIIDLDNGSSDFSYTLTNSSSLNTIELQYSNPDGSLNTNTSFASNETDGSYSIANGNPISYPSLDANFTPQVSLILNVNGYVTSNQVTFFDYSGTGASISDLTVNDNGNGTSNYDFTISGLSAPNEVVTGWYSADSGATWNNMGTIESDGGNGYFTGSPFENPSPAAVIVMVSMFDNSTGITYYSSAVSVTWTPTPSIVLNSADWLSYGSDGLYLINYDITATSTSGTFYLQISPDNSSWSTITSYSGGNGETTTEYGNPAVTTGTWYTRVIDQVTPSIVSNSISFYVLPSVAYYGNTVFGTGITNYSFKINYVSVVGSISVWPQYSSDSGTTWCYYGYDWSALSNGSISRPVYDPTYGTFLTRLIMNADSVDNILSEQTQSASFTLSPNGLSVTDFSAVDNGDATTTYDWTSAGLSGADEGDYLQFSTDSGNTWISASEISANNGNGAQSLTNGNPGSGTVYVRVEIIESSNNTFSPYQEITWSVAPTIVLVSAVDGGDHATLYSYYHENTTPGFSITPEYSTDNASWSDERYGFGGGYDGPTYSAATTNSSTGPIYVRVKMTDGPFTVYSSSIFLTWS